MLSDTAPGLFSKVSIGIPPAFPDAQTVNNPQAMQKTQVHSLGQEDNLEKEVATHSSILAWNITWTEEPGGLQSMDCKGSDTTE